MSYSISALQRCIFPFYRLLQQTVTHQLRSPLRYEQELPSRHINLRETKLLWNGAQHELQRLNGGAHPALDKRKQEGDRETDGQTDAVMHSWSGVCLGMGVSTWEFASWGCGKIRLIFVVRLLNRLEMAANGCRQCRDHTKNCTGTVMNGRAGTVGLLSNDFADKWVQLIIIFDPHELVDDVASAHGDYCRNSRYLEGKETHVLSDRSYRDIGDCYATQLDTMRCFVLLRLHMFLQLNLF